MSLDGYIEDNAGKLDWLMVDQDESYVQEFLSRFDIVFFGRVAYEQYGSYLASHDSSSSENPLSNFGRQLRKYVFSRTLKHVEGNGMVINRNIRETVQHLKEEEGNDIWLFGGAGIIRSFTALQLIDEYILAIQPVILGRGKPLFEGLSQQVRLHLIGAETLTSGVTILNYRPVSKLKKSAFVKLRAGG